MVGTNIVQLFVFANDTTQEALLVARLDNLGKGASGAAIQNLNLMLNVDETLGLTARI
jgi:N-acetyl-gamma-glutamyl-phosphate reductase